VVTTSVDAVLLFL